MDAALSIERAARTTDYSITQSIDGCTINQWAEVISHNTYLLERRGVEKGFEHVQHIYQHQGKCIWVWAFMISGAESIELLAFMNEERCYIEHVSLL